VKRASIGIGSHRRLALSEKRLPYLLTLPSLLTIFGVLIIPILYSLFLSVHNLVLSSRTYEFVGLKHYIAMFSDKSFLNSIWQTLVFTVLSVAAAVAFLAIGLIGYLLKKGLPYVNRAFLFTEPDILMDSYGIKPMIINTIYTVVLTLIFCIPLGIGSAIYLAEYAKQGKIVSGIRFAIEILAGIPSIVYGLFGLNFFVRKMAIGDYAGSMLAASLTLTLIVLPTMIRTTEESLLAVSQTYREAAIATGMSKFYMIRKIILPCAISGIVVAIILSIGRMVSESAALLYTAGIAQDLPSSVMSHVTEPGATMTVQLYLYATEGGAPEWVPYAMAAVLMVFVLFIEILTHVIAAVFKKRRKG